MGKKVVVIGGGIIGLSCAYYLHKEGHEVTVLDKSEMNGGASYVNAGYLVPSHFIPLAAPGMINQGLRYMLNSASPFYIQPRWDMDFLKWAWSFKKSCSPTNVQRAIPVIKEINLLSKALFEDIKRSNELGEFHLENKGLLMAFQTDKQGEEEQAMADKAKHMGLEVRYLDAEAIKELEPSSGIQVKGAYHYLCDAHSTPGVFMQRMQEYLTSVGVEIHKNAEVQEVVLSNRRIDALVVNTTRYSADEVVLAAGSWSSVLGKKLGVPLQLEAGKGYCIDVEQHTGITMPTLLCEAKIAVTPMQGFTRFAGTMEFSGRNHKIRPERVRAIAKGGERFYHELKIKERDIKNAKNGLRPVSPDGLPYIGKSMRIPNLCVATGHAMMGWSLGPATGKLISELVSDKSPSLDLVPFKIERKF